MWGVDFKFFIFFLFLLVSSSSVVFAADTDVYFAIPGSSASLFPVVDNVDFVSTGVHGFNCSLYLVSSNPDMVNLTNGAFVNGSLSRPDGGFRF